MTTTTEGERNEVERTGPRPFMECFYALADVDVATRHSATVDLISHLRGDISVADAPKPDLNYAIKRLVRGLAHREALPTRLFLAFANRSRLTSRKFRRQTSLINLTPSELDLKTLERAQNLAKTSAILCLLEFLGVLRFNSPDV